MKPDKWKIIWGVLLIILSMVFYLAHFIIFRDAHHLFIFLVGDVAFVFIEVLLVTMIIHELLNYRDKKSKLEKLNMVIGAFFSEVGTELVGLFSRFDHNADTIQGWLTECGKWPEDRFFSMNRQCRLYEYKIDCCRGDMKALRDFLIEKRAFLLNLLQNGNLMEHESFTNLLWAVFHLTEELEARQDVGNLSKTDCRHIDHDIERAYVLLIAEWLDYMKHLKLHYPYLFSLAIRTNPFDPEASPEVTE